MRRLLRRLAFRAPRDQPIPVAWGAEPPAKPYEGQLWLRGNTLFRYDGRIWWVL